jgi:hypothetical protein
MINFFITLSQNPITQPNFMNQDTTKIRYFFYLRCFAFCLLLAQCSNPKDSPTFANVSPQDVCENMEGGILQWKDCK